MSFHCCHFRPLDRRRPGRSCQHEIDHEEADLHRTDRHDGGLDGGVGREEARLDRALVRRGRARAGRQQHAQPVGGFGEAREDEGGGGVIVVVGVVGVSKVCAPAFSTGGATCRDVGGRKGAVLPPDATGRHGGRVRWLRAGAQAEEADQQNFL